MAKVVIVADDLTGANATSVLLVRQGFRASTFLNLAKYSEEAARDLDVISISTDSRGLTKEEAYRRVTDVLETINPEHVAFFSKRIDSTLRGNIGMEMKAMLEYHPQTMAVIVPSFPGSGRVCIGGYLLVNQIPLENTDVGKDPKAPVKHSKVETIVGEQYDGQIASIHLNSVLKGSQCIAQELKKAEQAGIRVVIVDATCDEDIENIAIAVKQAGISILTVDPGPFTSAMAAQLLKRPQKAPGKRILMTIGSVSNLTRRQIEQMRLKYNPLIYQVDAMNLLEAEDLDRESDKATRFLLDRMADYEIMGVTTTTNEDEVLNLKEVATRYQTTEEEISNRISNGLARITHQILKNSSDNIGGLYTSGGDVTVAVCRELNSSGIIIKDEVLPLAVYGRIFEGDFDHYPIITKGGLVGGDDALIQCVDYLLTKISTDYYRT